MDINFELYKTFCTVAEYESITKAAKELNISQPALTKSIKKLEDSLNGTLFIRQQKGIVLTNEGKALYEYIKPAIIHIENSSSVFNDQVKINKGKIRIGTSLSLFKYYIIKNNKDFFINNDTFNIYIEDNKTSNIINKIKDGSLDIGIVSTSYASLKKYNNIKYYIIEELEHGLFASNKYLEKNKKVYSINDLLKYTFVINENSNKNYIKDFNIKNYIKVSSNTFVYDLINENVGLGFGIKNYMKNNHKVHEIKIKEELPKNILVIITNDNNYQNYATKLLLNELKK